MLLRDRPYAVKRRGEECEEKGRGAKEGREEACGVGVVLEGPRDGGQVAVCAGTE